MTEFTKGPYRKVVHSWSDISVYAGDKVICTASIRDEVTEKTEEAMICELEANMQLISAAPDMYEALKAARTDLMLLQGNVRESIKVDPNWEGIPEMIDGYIARADKALAKAEGK